MSSIEEFKKEYDKLFNSDKVRNNLMLVGLYLSIFETLKFCLINNVKSFFCFDNFPNRYTEVIKKYYPEGKNGKRIPDKFLAGAKWHLEVNAISEKEVHTVRSIRTHRNAITHELPSYLIEPEKEINEYLMLEAVKLIEKIDIWWFVNVEQDINFEPGDERFDETAEGVFSGKMAYIWHLLESAGICNK